MNEFKYEKKNLREKQFSFREQKLLCKAMSF